MSGEGAGGLAVSSAYLWFDTEYTTLDLGKARLLQVALVITDTGLNRIGPVSDDINLYVKLEPDIPVSPWVQETMPDVVEICRSDKACTVEEIDRRLCEVVDRHVVVPMGDDKKRPILAGNSIHADWHLANRFLPGFSALTHYRHLDVTTLKLQWQDWFGGEPFEKDDDHMVSKYCPSFTPSPLNRAHDAYYDVQASIAELHYYRRKLLQAPPSNPS